MMTHIQPIPASFLLFLTLMVTTSVSHAATSSMSLAQAIALAQQADPWQTGNRLSQKAAQARGQAADSLPNPTMSVNAMNLPTDHWHFRQEGMSQLQLAVAQRFPRGDSVQIERKIWQTHAGKHPLMQQDRQAMLRLWVTELWLDAYAAHHAVRLISGDRSLFEQIQELATASYASAIGSVRQQDIIRAQLEITQLDERLLREQQDLEIAAMQLTRWLPDDTDFAFLGLDTSPGVQSLTPEQAQVLNANAAQTLYATLLNHPRVRVFDSQQSVAEQKVQLAEQSYKSQWSVNAAYGLRSDSDKGVSRADLFSVGVSFDLPMFTQRRQDANVSAAVAEASAVETDKRLLLQEMASDAHKDYRLLQSLQRRKAIYDQRLLAQLNEQAESVLTAYTNDDGDFAEVVRARIAQLNARLDVLQLEVDALKATARLQYRLTQSDSMHTTQQKGAQ